MLPALTATSNARENWLTVELKNENRKQCACLGDAELDGVVGGARDLGRYNRMFELMSKIIQSASETKKAIIANIR